MTPLNKADYDKKREAFLNDERYLNASSEDKEKMLDNFYSKYTTSYLAGQNADEKEVERLRGVFKAKYGPQKKKRRRSRDSYSFWRGVGETFRTFRSIISGERYIR